MTKKNLWLGILAITLVFTIGVVGCDNDSTDDDSTDNPQTVEYKGEDATGNVYTLTVTQNRAVYAGKQGDNYKLVIKMKDGTEKTSKGKIASVSTDGTFTLQPSVEGSGSFSVVISGEDIKSIVGSISIEGGTPITAGTFDTVYLRAWRWVSATGEYGELWGTSPCVKIADFINGFKVGNTYTVKISGTADRRLYHPEVQFVLVKKGVVLCGLGNGKMPAIDAGSFNRTINLTVNYDFIPEGLDGSEEPFVQLNEELNYHNPDHPQWDNDYGMIPGNIPDGTIMATIRNFSMVIQK